MLAVSLFSGGLDSCLAIKIIQEQGIDVIALNVNTGFESKLEKENYLKNTAKELGINTIFVFPQFPKKSAVFLARKIGAKVML